MNSNLNMADQAIDVSGSKTVNSNKVLAEEPLSLGHPISGGSGATIFGFSGPNVTLTGLSGLTNDVVGKFLTISGAVNPTNNGTFPIISYVSPTSLIISNSDIVFPDTGSLTWTQRFAYSLEDDLNFERTDRALIKGTTYFGDVPTYVRPSDLTTNIPANLTNIAGNTTDAKAIIYDKFKTGLSVTDGYEFFVVSGAGEFPYSNINNVTGIPTIQNGDSLEECLVEIFDNSTQATLKVIDGYQAGNTIVGFCYQGSGVSPNSLEIRFYSLPTHELETTYPYIWESAQTNSIFIYYPYRELLSDLSDSNLRKRYVVGAGTSSDFTTTHKTLRDLIHFVSDGPADGFGPTLFKETLPNADPFPTSIIWWSSPAKTIKIIEKTLVYNSSKFPITITWTMYSSSGIAIKSAIDDITYSGPFEISRERTFI